MEGDRQVQSLDSFYGCHCRQVIEGHLGRLETQNLLKSKSKLGHDIARAAANIPGYLSSEPVPQYLPIRQLQEHDLERRSIRHP
jgi:hypothetical protein